MKTILKTKMIAMTLLAITTGVASMNATPTLTTTWSDATTSWDFHDRDFTADIFGNILDTATSWYTTDSTSKWTKVVKPSTMTFSHHNRYIYAWGTCGSCVSCSSSGRTENNFWDKFTGGRESALPIVHTLHVDDDDAPSLYLDLTYVGTYAWTNRYQKADGTVEVDGDFNHGGPDVNYTANAELYGLRGYDQYFASIYSPSDTTFNGDYFHTSAHSNIRMDQLTCALTYAVAYDGPENTAALLEWYMTPKKYFEQSVTSGGTTRGQALETGSSTGPGTQVSWPFESFFVHFSEVAED